VRFEQEAITWDRSKVFFSISPKMILFNIFKNTKRNMIFIAQGIFWTTVTSRKVTGKNIHFLSRVTRLKLERIILMFFTCDFRSRNRCPKIPCAINIIYSISNKNTTLLICISNPIYLIQLGHLQHGNCE
jgi:hypothetical protein